MYRWKTRTNSRLQNAIRALFWGGLRPGRFWMKCNGARSCCRGCKAWKGVGIIRQLIHAFYDPEFSFPKFAQRFPEQRAALIDCLIGDVVGKDMSSFTAALEQMTPPPGPDGALWPHRNPGRGHP